MWSPGWRWRRCAHNDHRDTVARLDGVADVTTVPVLRVEQKRLRF